MMELLLAHLVETLKVNFSKCFAKYLTGNNSLLKSEKPHARN